MSREVTCMERSALIYKVQEINKWCKSNFRWRRGWMFVMGETVCLVTLDTNLSSLMVVDPPPQSRR